jgi:hypothetical protein
LTDDEKKMRLFRASKLTSEFGYENWNKTRITSAVSSPEIRSYHVGCTMGCGYFIHGGSGAFGRGILSDWNLFDFGLSVWIKLDVLKEDGSKFDLDRKMHSMTSVLASDKVI